MKANFKKGLIGYVFLFVLGSACVVTGAVSFNKNVPSAIFSIIVGLIIIGIGIMMAFRKN